MKIAPSTFYLAGLIFLCLSWSCAGRSPSTHEPGTNKNVTAVDSELSATQKLVQEARSEMERGESLLGQQRRDEARLAFNRAIDILLGCEGGAESHPEIGPIYDRIVLHIHALDLSETSAADEERPDQTLWQDDLDAAVNVSDVALGEPAAPSSSGAQPFDLPIEMNKRVEAVIQMFQERRRDWFQSALYRSGRYIEYAGEVFHEEGLPQDLVYLAMVESAFKPRAVSRAGAGGVWQFMRGTGRLYGLRRDYWVDERFDPEKSTRAAAEHLRDLYEEFGDWYLVMAAYNAGPNKVKRAIAQTGSRDFWELSKTRYLRRETKSYVPLILATIVIAKDPERYGFDTEREPRVTFDVVELDSPIDLNTAAKCAETSLSDMKNLNPELRQWVTPPDRGQWFLKLPEGSRDKFCAALESIPPEDRVRFVTYTVRRGDTLSQIARRYRTSVTALADTNHIGRRYLIKPGQVLTVPVPEGTVPQRSSSPNRLAELAASNGGSVHVVQAGDTLSEIADAYGVSLGNLRDWNGLGRRSLIHPGQKLVVETESAATEDGRLVYRVQRGDTLAKIARRFSVSVADLQRWNKLSHDRIYVGDSLEIFTASP